MKGICFDSATTSIPASCPTEIPGNLRGVCRSVSPPFRVAYTLVQTYLMLLRQILARSAPVSQSLQQLAAAVCLAQSGQPTVPALSGANQCIAASVSDLQLLNSWATNSVRCISSSTGSNAATSSRSSSHSSQQTSTAVREPSIKQLRAEIFEQHIGDGRRSGRKAILKPLKGRMIADWYFTLTGPKMHMFDDPIEEE